MLLISLTFHFFVYKVNTRILRMLEFKGYTFQIINFSEEYNYMDLMHCIDRIVKTVFLGCEPHI